MSLPARRHLAHARGSISSGQEGIALPAAMFALVTAGILGGAMLTFSTLSTRAGVNQESATRAVQVADAGVAHALGLLRGSLKSHSFTRILRGSDNFVPTADDSLFIDYGLPLADQIPLVGKTFQGQTYFVTVRDDPADGDANASTDLNGRVLVRCTVLTNDGASVEVTAILGATPMPALAADGNVNFSGSPQVLGACGGAHANGNIHASGGGPIISTQATATGAATGTWTLPNGSPAPVLSNQPEVVIPDLNPMDYCAGAEFRLLSTGTATNGAGMLVAVPGGWSYNAGTKLWSLAGGASVDGTYCVQGNVSVSGNTGTAATPRRMTILASGSIEVTGTPFITAEHEDGMLFMAAGDVRVAGNPSAGAYNYQGMIYAGAQCVAAGNATMFGQLLCANGPQPLGAIEHAVSHSMSGNFVLTFDCSSNVFNKRRVLYWYPRIGV
jgi:hypothetical protein